jgi:predicted dehydrogenase
MEEIYVKKTKMAIMGPGGIAGLMAYTVTSIPEIERYAVGSRDLGRAQAFAEKYGFQKAYGSYEELVRDPDVELVYVATPHSHHYENTMLCIDHGKHALVEKAFTVNAKQAGKLLEYAVEKKVLVTEAIWTRYMPSRNMINELLDSGVIGTPNFLTANLGYLISHIRRITDPMLAGGTLLDLGVYTINFASMVFGDKVTGLSAEAVLFDTGVDAMNNFTMRFEGGKTAFMYCTAMSQTDREGVIYGDKGRLVIDNINNPERIHVFDLNYNEIACHEVPQQITGYEYQVISAVKAIEEGRLECPEMPHSETIRIMELMDSIRATRGYKYPFED